MSDSSPADRATRRLSTGLSAPPSPFLDSPSSSTAVPSLLRRSRMEEKNELQELNRRLELYIMRAREKDASAGGLTREMSLLRQKHAADLTALRRHHEQRYNELKQSKLDLAAQLQSVQDAHAKVRQQAKDHATSSNLLHDRCVELEKRLKEVEKELSEQTNMRIALDTQVKRLKTDYEVEKEAHGLLKKQMDAQREQLQQAQKQYSLAQNKSNGLQQELELLQTSSREEITRLNKQVDALTRENTSIEDSLRTEFGKQLQSLLRERQQQYEEEKEEMMTDLKAYYEQTLNEKSIALVRVQEELDAASRRASDAQRQVSEQKKQSDSAEGMKAAFERQLSSLQTALEQQRIKYETELTAKTDQLKHANATIATKQREFSQLMDVKIALDQEIKQYNKLLEHEEHRLGFADEEEEEFIRKHPSPLRQMRKAAASVAGATATPSTPVRAPSSSAKKSAAASSTGKSAAYRRGNRLFGGSEAEHEAENEDATMNDDSTPDDGFADAATSLQLTANPSTQRITIENIRPIDEESPLSNRVSLRDLFVYSSGSGDEFHFDAEDSPVKELRAGAAIVFYLHGRKPHIAAGSEGSVAIKWERVDEQYFWEESIMILDQKRNIVKSQFLKGE